MKPAHTPFRVNRDASDHKLLLVDVAKRATVAIKNQPHAVEVDIWPYRNLNDEYPLSRCTAPLPEQHPAPGADPLQLFFLCDDLEREGNTDLLVWARNPAEAVGHWRSYYGNDEVGDREPDKIWAVPLSPRNPGPISWNDPDGLCLVET